MSTKQNWCATVAAFLALSAPLCHDTASARAIRYIRLGPEFTAGASMSTGDVPESYKANPLFAWSAGALGEIPVSPEADLSLGLVYDVRGFTSERAQDGLHNNWSETYFSLRPGVRFSSFLAGLGLGIPLGTTVAGTVYSQSVNTKIESSNMNMLIEVRLGGSFELTKSETGDLRFLVEAAYPFTKIFTPDYLKDEPNVVFNGPIPTLQLGLTYLFNATELR